MVEIMTCLLMGKHFWIALVLATLLLKIVIAPLRIRRSAPHRSAPTSAASLRTVRQDTDIHRLRSQDIHLTPSHTGLQRHWEQGPSQWADLRRAVIQLQMEQAPIDTQRSVLPLPPATSLFAYDILPSMCLCLSAFVVCPSINTHTHTWFLRQSRREQLSFLCNQTLERSPETNF